MRHPVRTVLLGAFAAALLGLMGTAAWFVAGPSPAQTAEEVLPTPPEPPRLADGPEVENCLTLLQIDPEGARSYAERWAIAGGGEAAQHCQALAVLALGDAPTAAEQLEQIAARSRAGNAARAAVFAQSAQAWLMAGAPTRAFAAATLALTLSPEDVDLLIDRAVTLGALSRYREAIEDLDRALVLDAERAEALVFRAAAWRHLDRSEQALVDIGRALEITPDNPEALLERGIIRHLRGEVEAARADWERVIELAPDAAAADLATQNLALSDAGPPRR
jgi:tetratricopeptide (TPR) repeat protein